MFTYGNIYDNYNKEVNYILFANLSEKYLYYKKEYQFLFRISFKFLSYTFQNKFRNCSEKNMSFRQTHPGIFLEVSNPLMSETVEGLKFREEVPPNH